MKQLKDLMVRNVEVVHPDSTIKEVAERMGRLNIGVVPVFDGQQVIGVVTDRDIVVRCLCEGRNFEKCVVKDIMSTNVVTCFEDESLKSAAQQMKLKKVGRVIVLNRNHQFVGLLSLGVLAQELGDENLAGVVVDTITHIENKNSVVVRRVGTAIGAVVSVATLIAGSIYFRRQPEALKKLKNRLVKETSEVKEAIAKETKAA
jgi:CBS domain-containing protein